MPTGAKTISSLLRFSIAFSFLYPAIDGLLHPETWLSFVPNFVLTLLPVVGLTPETFLVGFEVFEIVIGIAILVMPRPVLPSMLAGLTLLGITGFNFSSWDIVFRDVSLAFAAFALARLHIE